MANPQHPRPEFMPFESWQDVESLAVELGPFGPLAIFGVGTGVRPEEAFGAEWSDDQFGFRCFQLDTECSAGRTDLYDHRSSD